MDKDKFCLEVEFKSSLNSGLKQDKDKLNFEFKWFEFDSNQSHPIHSSLPPLRRDHFVKQLRLDYYGKILRVWPNKCAA